MTGLPKEIMATAMRCLMAPEHEHVGNIAAALLAERKANEAERDRLREALEQIVSRDMHWDRTGDKLGVCGRIARAALAKEAGQ